MRIIRAMNNRVKAAAACLVIVAAVMGILNFKSSMPHFEIEPTLRGQPTPLPRLGANTKPISDGPTVFIPPSLDTATQRRLSLNLGGGACQWEPPEYDVPNDITFYKTLIAGYPSCDKRMTFTQMEALTGWPARDEWDFVFYGMANHPFIKSNYPHHEGYWAWGTLADQVVLVVRNMRRTMVEYFDIKWDIATAKKNNIAYNDILYRERPPIDSFFKWRDARVLDEIHWYGWFIDFWMEGGLKRDIFSHRLTTDEAWPYYPPENPTPECLNDPWHAHKTQANTCTNSGDYDTPSPTKPPTQYPTALPTPAPTQPPTVNGTNLTAFPIAAPTPVIGPPAPSPIPPPAPFLFSSREECCAAKFPGQECYIVDACPTPSPTPAITATYDAHCANNEIANGCEPVAVISAEKLRDLTEGPDETIAIANILTGRSGISEYLIDAEAWQCIWTELIPNGKGNRMVRDREGYTETDYNFSEEMLSEMIVEYDRLITKYTDSYWSSKQTAVRLVQLLMEARVLIQIELDEVQSQARTLLEHDFLGPKERERRRRLKAIEEGRDPNVDELTIEEKRKHFEYFMAMEENIKSATRADRARKRQEDRKAAARRKALEKRHKKAL